MPLVSLKGGGTAEELLSLQNGVKGVLSQGDNFTCHGGRLL